MKSKLGRTLAGLAALMLMFSFYSSRPAEAAHIKIGVLTCAAGVQVGKGVCVGQGVAVAAGVQVEKGVCVGAAVAGDVVGETAVSTALTAGVSVGNRFQTVSSADVGFNVGVGCQVAVGVMRVAGA